LKNADKTLEIYHIRDKEEMLRKIKRKKKRQKEKQGKHADEALNSEKEDNSKGLFLIFLI
jgi:hypothetical protein